MRALMLAVVLLAHPSLVAADADARALFEQGLESSRQEHWAEARDAYLRSLSLEPRPSTYYNLAAVSLKLRLGRAALLALEQFARVADPVEHAEFIAEADKLRARAAELVGTLELHVQPATAQVRIDEEPLPLASGSPRQVQLDLGYHVVHASLSGWKPWTGSVHIASGNPERLNIELDLVETARAGRTETQPESSAGKVLLWGAIGAASVALIVTAAILIDANQGPASSGGTTGVKFE